MSTSVFQRLLPLLFLLAGCVFPLAATGQIQLRSQSSAGSATLTTPHVQAELVAHAPDGIGPGKPLWLGLQITHQPEWHTYWKNPGDSGLPTELNWTLPPGLDAGEIAWPVPRKFALDSLANYGYDGTVLLPVPITVGSQFQGSAWGQGPRIELRASWLVCRKECIPEEGVFALQLPVQGTTALHAAAFDAAAKAQPEALAASGSQARVGADGTLQVRVQGLPAAWHGSTLDFYPETPEVIDNVAPWSQAWDGAAWTAAIPLAQFRSSSPDTLPAVLTRSSAAPQAPAVRTGYRTELAVIGPWPAPAPMASVSPALEAALKANAEQAGSGPSTTSASAPLVTPAPASDVPWLTLAVALLGALLGGLVLNLMPCVFPVLAIKVLGFTRHAHERRAHRVSGLAYTAGVVLSFLALGALMLALRAAGEAVGWGFQLQSPAVVAALAALFTLIALNLAGLFDFGHILPSSVASLQARHPVADSFLTGVLAVAVASPCTAPFMGASLGLTATLPAPAALAVFAALGLGLALPYLLASWVPAVARALPRPGPWMDTLRKLLAFPMLATVVWLVWVLGQQTGIDGAGSLLILLVGMALFVWALSQQGRARLWMGSVSLATLALMVWAFGPHVTATNPTTPSQSASAAQATPASAPTAAGQWLAWTPTAAEEWLAAGRPVFVDYTAAWCVTCQYNKKTTLADASVLADLQSKRVVLLRADWTRRDPAITAALQQLGRNGVPVYVLHAPGRAPVVMSEILTVPQVRQAIAGL